LGCLLGLGLGGGVGDPHTENPPICEAEQEKKKKFYERNERHYAGHEG